MANWGSFLKGFAGTFNPSLSSAMDMYARKRMYTKMKEEELAQRKAEREENRKWDIEDEERKLQRLGEEDTLEKRASLEEIMYQLNPSYADQFQMRQQEHPTISEDYRQFNRGQLAKQLGIGRGLLKAQREEAEIEKERRTQERQERIANIYAGARGDRGPSQAEIYTGKMGGIEALLSPEDQGKLANLPKGSLERAAAVEKLYGARAKSTEDVERAQNILSRQSAYLALKDTLAQMSIADNPEQKNEVRAQAAQNVNQMLALILPAMGNQPELAYDIKTSGPMGLLGTKVTPTGRASAMKAMLMQQLKMAGAAMMNEMGPTQVEGLPGQEGVEGIEEPSQDDIMTFITQVEQMIER